MMPGLPESTLVPSRARRFPCLAACLLLALCAGCQDIDTTYGRRANSSSVNGTAVLGDMFAEAGHNVASWPWLSPRLTQDADVIVWFPDNFAPPSAKVRNWLENWLLGKPGRTLIYVGRDYDAATEYWRKVRVGAAKEQYAELSRKLAEAQADFTQDRASIPTDEDAEWFRIDGKLQPRSVRTLSGRADWLSDIDPTKVEIELNSRQIPAQGDEIILESAGDAIITRSEWGDSQLVVVTNGSLFLNLKLINHEHRELAGHLIDLVGPAPLNVYFLDSVTPEARIYEEEPAKPSGNPLEQMLRDPLDHISLQLALLGLLFAWSRLPIFGIPRKIPPPPLADFGQHVAAVGELLAATRNEQYARDRLKAYQQSVRHDLLRSRLNRSAEPTGTSEAPAASPAPAESTINHSQAVASDAEAVASRPASSDNPTTLPPSTNA